MTLFRNLPHLWAELILNETKTTNGPEPYNRHVKDQFYSISKRKILLQRIFVSAICNRFVSFVKLRVMSIKKKKKLYA